MFRLCVCLALCFASCSPLKTSLHDDRFQWELTIHEAQTNVEDLKHDARCVQAEMQILEGRLKAMENAFSAFKQTELEKQQHKIEQLSDLVVSLEKKWNSWEKKGEHERGGVDLLSTHAKETSLALSQFKARIEELESELTSQNRKLEVVLRLKNSLESLTKSMKAKTHKVKAGDSLEKIARMYQTDVVTLKKLNELHNDLIVVDQEISLP